MMYAKVFDLRVRWSGAPESDELIEAKLEDASVYINSVYGEILPKNIDGDLKTLLKSITCAIARRSLNAEMQGGSDISQISRTAGPFSENTTYRNPDGNYFLTAAEREALEGLLKQVGKKKHRGMITVDATGW